MGIITNYIHFLCHVVQSRLDSTIMEQGLELTQNMPIPQTLQINRTILKLLKYR